jgi:hypothetical protein
MNLETDPRFETEHEHERVSTGTAGTMGEPEGATPRSSTETPQLKAAKDKNCPFCGQAFTSSSLGRHLDLYIRPKNPKTADGIHLVDEIRKLRGGITRRQAKGSVSLSRRDESGASTPAPGKKQSVASEGSSTLVHSPGDDEDDDDDGDGDELRVGKPRTAFADVSWGSARRRPSRALGAKTPDMRRDASRALQKADLEQRGRAGDEGEIASATELALRELLKSVQEAKYDVPPRGWHVTGLTPRVAQRRPAAPYSTSTRTRSTSPHCVCTSCPRLRRSSRRRPSPPPSRGPSPRRARSSSTR